nr:venom protein [Lampona murina]
MKLLVFLLAIVLLVNAESFDEEEIREKQDVIKPVSFWVGQIRGPVSFREEVKTILMNLITRDLIERMNRMKIANKMQFKNKAVNILF